ncbi:50S ribosomal protein L7ae [Candidatus Micrarchaeota archaeon]|nr:50S ribosomal protein L7ae [Candidatus Micrarchaeota archaeon]
MASYVKSETPEEIVSNVIEALSVAKSTGKLRKGINETTKSVEKKAAKLVVMAEDVQPEEIIIHMPSLCEEKGIPYTYVPSKKDLGAAVGMGVGTSSIAIEDAGSAAELLAGILKRLPKSGASAEEEKKEAPKKEEKPKKEKKDEAPKGEKKEKESPKEEKPKEEKKEEPAEEKEEEGKE